MIDVKDHSLIIYLRGKTIMIRPCNDLTGRFGFNGVVLPWFKVTTMKSASGLSTWSLFSVPFLCFAWITLTKKSD